jgi:hypothetical protein
MDASYVSFPNKTGIIFSSNRPNPNVKGGDTSLPSLNRYNVFLADYDEKAGFRQITQLTEMPFGNARFPMQYNVNHYTFVSDQNGVGNRYAGFFSTRADGIDTLVKIGDEILRNPSMKEIDSTLLAWDLPEPDSPTMAKVSPRKRSKETPRIACKIPYWVLNEMAKSLTSKIFSAIDLFHPS